jgi:putative endonuclease
MFYVYVLHSKKDGRRYIGYTSDLKNRLIEHEKGRVVSTKERRPLELVYYEACIHQSDATAREKYLKGQWGYKYLNKRLKHNEEKLRG